MSTLYTYNNSLPRSKQALRVLLHLAVSFLSLSDHMFRNFGNLRGDLAASRRVSVRMRVHDQAFSRVKGVLLSLYATPS